MYVLDNWRCANSASLSLHKRPAAYSSMRYGSVMLALMQQCRLVSHGSAMCLAQDDIWEFEGRLPVSQRHQPNYTHSDTAQVGSQPRGPIELMGKQAADT